jgi:ribonuclease Z
MSASSDLSVQIIGSGAVRALPHRGGPCYLVTLNGRKLVFDVGRCAVHNLHRLGTPVESIDEIFITHLHFDHICDLPLLLLLSWNNGREVHIPIHGPKGINDFLEHGVRTAYAADINSRISHGNRVREKLDWNATEITTEGTICETDDYRIDVLATAHAGLANWNYRITTTDKIVVITSDTEPDQRLVDFCRDADLMLVECSGTKEFFDTVAFGGWHIAPEDVGQIARDAGVKRVVLKHFVQDCFTDDPNVAESLAEIARKIYPAGEIHAATDGLKFEL